MENKGTSIFEKLRLDLQVRPYYSLAYTWESLTPNQNLACYLMYLLQVLDHEAPSFSKDRREGLYALLQKKLTFLHALLGDTPFQWIVVQDTIHLLFEFEMIANECGSFIYSVVSATSKKMRKRKFDTGIKALFNKVQVFINEKIKVHCMKELPQTAASRSNHLSSLFIIGSLLEDLESLMDGRFESNNRGITDQIKTLSEELTFFLPFLKDLEKPQVAHTNDELQDSLVYFIDATYEAEYLINAWTAGLIPSWYLNLRIPFVVRKIKTISGRVRNIENNHSVKLKEIKVQVLRYPEDDASTVVGFENIKETVLADLVGGARTLQYISIFGMSGIGKSTVAKKFYNDLAVRDHFDIHVWCTISQRYDKKKVLEDIWKTLPRKSGKDEILNNESLALGIYQTLIGRKYLIIMDDVWDSHIWDDLRRYFPDNGNGSRILVTSQIKDSAPAGSIFHQLPLLSNSQCYDLLVKKVFIKQPFPPELLDIALTIASKCHGLPLTVIVLAGILANVRDESVWRNVERKMDSYRFAISSMQILELSYKYLPNHLKPCFLSLGWSFFKKDVQVKEVIRLWISHGFVDKDENKSREDIAEEYLLELINRSLLIISKRRSDGGIKACEFHDLIHDMCLETAKTEKFYSYLDLNSSFIYREHPHLYLGEARSNICSISTLHCRSVSYVISALGYSVTQMPLVRVIKDQDSPIDAKRVSGLVHLRYFSSYVPIAQLPEVISKLVNLEYLLLHTGSIVDAPSSILKMVKMRHIHIEKQVIFLKNCDISQIRNNVKSLSCVHMRNREDEEILKCSPHLQKLKCICEGFFPDLSYLTLLESLNMSVFDSPRPKGELTKLNFPSTLKKVTLSGTNLPWEESSVVGRLPNLQVLKLLHDAFCGKEWETRDDEFKELRFLKIYNILSLRQWTSWSEHFPKLRNLLLGHVRVEIPVDFGNISTLQSIEVGNCGNETYESADMIREDQLEYENDYLKIIIRDTNMHGLVSPPTLAPQEQPNMDSSQHEASASRFRRHICQSCNTEIYGKGTIGNGSYWHDECLCCHACKERIYDSEFNILDDRPFHRSCYKELRQPRCDVCKDYARTNADGEYDHLTHQFWDQNYCRSHTIDGTPECCGCDRLEPMDVKYLILEDGRSLCLECKESSIMKNAEECEALYMEIQDFLEGLNIKVKQEIPPCLVDKQAMDEATQGEGQGTFWTHLVYNDHTSVVTSNTTDNDDSIITLLILSGLPRMLTGCSIALRMMDAWMLLEGYPYSSVKVRVGIRLLLSHMWLEHEIEKGGASEYEKKLGDYWKYVTQNDSRLDYRDGFWEGKKAVDKYGLKRILDNIRRIGTFDHIAYRDYCSEDAQHPKCYVCKDFVPIDANGDYNCLTDQFWDLNYCPLHETDKTSLCCGCDRFETMLEDDTYLILDDVRALCLECKEASIVMNTEECHPLYMEIEDFFQSLNIKVKHKFRVLLVDKQAMVEATGGDYDSYLVYNGDGADDPTEVVNTILVLSGFPRMVTGYFIAFRIMYAWLSDEGYQDLSSKVKVGICRLLSHMWLEHEIVSDSSEKVQLSEFEKKLGEYHKYMIQNESDSDYNYWESKKAVDKYGLKHTLDHICHTGAFPD